MSAAVRLRLPVARAVLTGQRLWLAAFPHGGQAAARRNAWAAMAADAARARARREAAAALAAATSALPAVSADG